MPREPVTQDQRRERVIEGLAAAICDPECPTQFTPLLMEARKMLAATPSAPTPADCACLKPGGDPLGNCAVCDPPTLQCTPPADMEGAAALAIAIGIGCGLTINGRRALCDDPEAMESAHEECGCRNTARAALAAVSALQRGPCWGTCPKCGRTRLDFDCAEDDCAMAAAPVVAEKRGEK